MNTKKIYALIFVLFLSAGISQGADISIKAKNVDRPHKSTTTVLFPSANPDDKYILANQYIKLEYDVDFSTIPKWRVDIYSKPESDEIISQLLEEEDGFYQFGGLFHKSHHEFRLPLLWQSFDSKKPKESIQLGTETWKYIKNKNDKDIPGTSADESWDNAWQGGYTSIDITKSSSSVFYIYLEGEYKNLAGGHYKGEIWFDIYQAVDLSPPAIEHQGIDRIGSLGNDIILQARIKDNKEVKKAWLMYRINKGDWKRKDFNIKGWTRSLKAGWTIKSSEVQEGTLEYYIGASDGINESFWKNEKEPKEIEISTGNVFKNVRKGRLVIYDGNPFDGETSLYIPEGALDSPVDIEIIQMDPSDKTVPGGNDPALTDRPIVLFKFKPEGLKFNIPVTITLLYYDIDQDGIIDDTEYKEQSMGMFYWDGFEWRLLGGDVDTYDNTVSAETKHFSMYGLFPMRALTEDDYKPKEKIITPALKDDVNDEAVFDGLNGEYEIKIFNARGRKVKSITQDTYGEPVWDGTDNDGRIVESGVYIYQFKALVKDEYKYVTGTIVVAK